jgi:expansin (peptidoglycan-binding protein)
MSITRRQEILDARRSFPETQDLLRGIPVRRAGGAVEVGWHDQTLDIEAPAFATVRPGGLYADLVGEILRVVSDGREAFVYVHRSAGTDADVSLCRRAFMELGPLWNGTITCVVEVL